MILRYEVPVDDAWHTIRVNGDIVHVACRKPDLVEFWTLDNGPTYRRVFRVFGTGQPLPEEDSCTRPTYVGTALTPGQALGDYSVSVGELVWHLFELVEVDAAERSTLDMAPLGGSVETPEADQ